MTTVFLQNPKRWTYDSSPRKRQNSLEKSGHRARKSLTREREREKGRFSKEILALYAKGNPVYSVVPVLIVILLHTVKFALEFGLNTWT